VLHNIKMCVKNVIITDVIKTNISLNVMMHLCASRVKEDEETEI